MVKLLFEIISGRYSWIWWVLVMTEVLSRRRDGVG